jgi:hypothetical protein
MRLRLLLIAGLTMTVSVADAKSQIGKHAVKQEKPYSPCCRTCGPGKVACGDGCILAGQRCRKPGGCACDR